MADLRRTAAETTTTTAAAGTTVVSRVTQLADLAVENADDTVAERVVYVATERQHGRSRSLATAVISSSSSRRRSAPLLPERDSEFRLAWLWVEGWRAKLRKGGDVVEKARWEWRVEDLLGASRRRAMTSVPDIVATVPSSMKKTKGKGNNNPNRARGEEHGSRKSVRFQHGHGDGDGIGIG